MTKALSSSIPSCIPRVESLYNYLALLASYEHGVPETIRTSDPFLRREVLYPAELRGQRLIYIQQQRQ